MLIQLLRSRIPLSFALIVVALAAASCESDTERHGPTPDAKPPSSHTSTRTVLTSDAAPSLYTDKNDYFSFVPPAGWIQKDYPTDPRSKVQFDCPDAREVLLRIIAEVASPGLSSDNVVEMVRERARVARSRLGSGFRMEVEQGTFSGVPAAVTRQSFSGQAQGEQEVTIFVAGTVMFNIAYSAPNRTMLEKYRAIAEESLCTLVVGQEALKVLDDETLRKHLVTRHLRIAQLFARCGDFANAKKYLADVVKQYPDDARLREAMELVKQGRPISLDLDPGG